MTKAIEAFMSLVAQVPCCSCCSSDEGYVEGVLAAMGIMSFSNDEKEQIRKAACDDFKYGAGWDRRREHEES